MIVKHMREELSLWENKEEENRENKVDVRVDFEDTF